MNDQRENHNETQNILTKYTFTMLNGLLNKRNKQLLENLITINRKTHFIGTLYMLRTGETSSPDHFHQKNGGTRHQEVISLAEIQRMLIHSKPREKLKYYKICKYFYRL